MLTLVILAESTHNSRFHISLPNGMDAKCCKCIYKNRIFWFLESWLSGKLSFHANMQTTNREEMNKSQFRMRHTHKKNRFSLFLDAVCDGCAQTLQLLHVLNLIFGKCCWNNNALLELKMSTSIFKTNAHSAPIVSLHQTIYHSHNSNNINLSIRYICREWFSHRNKKLSSH